MKMGCLSRSPTHPVSEFDLIKILRSSMTYGSPRHSRVASSTLRSCQLPDTVTAVPMTQITNLCSRRMKQYNPPCFTPSPAPPSHISCHHGCSQRPNNAPRCPRSSRWYGFSCTLCQCSFSCKSFPNPPYHPLHNISIS